jgi:hypothetical protein
MTHSSRFRNFFRKILPRSEGVVLFRSNNAIVCHFLLEALQENHIAAYLSQESVGQYIYPVNVGKLAETEIVVAQKDYPKAKDILDSLLAQMQENAPDSADENRDETLAD